MIFCIPALGAVMGAASTSWLTTRYGRKWVIVAAYILSYGGTFLQTFAPNLGAFVFGRFFNQICVAWGTTICVLYLSEVVPAKYRGAAVTSSNIMSLIAGVISTVIANRTHTMKGSASFQIPLGFQAVMPTFLIPLTIFMPESPLWLLSKGRQEEARANLRKLRAFDDALVDDELRLMKVTLERDQALTKNAKFFDLFNKKNIQRTMVAGSMYSVNQCSGIILSSTYSTIFLTSLGVGNPFQLTIASSCCILAGTIIATLAFDRVGRRPVAIIGMSSIFVIDIVAGVLAFYPTRPNVPITIAVLGFIFNVIWASSFYPLSVTLPTELPTPALRNMTTSYTLACAYTTSIITTFAAGQLISADAANLGAKTYLVFGGIVLVIFVVYYIFLPESAGRTFAEIDEMYENKVSPRKFKSYKTSAVNQQAKVVGSEA